MDKLTIFLFALLFSPFFLKSETIEISTVDWCPYICPDDKDKPGVLVEYTKAIFEGSGYQVNFVPYPWSRGIQNTQNGHTDALLAPAKEEAPNLLFPKQHLTQQRNCFFTRATSNWRYDTPDSVDGMAILYPKDSLPKEIAKYQNSNEFVPLPYSRGYFLQAVGMLDKERVDAILMAMLPAKYYININNLNGGVRFAGCVQGQRIYLAFTPDAHLQSKVERLMSAYDSKVATLKQQGFFETLLKKYKLKE